MKWAVVVFPGSNCDGDAAESIRTATKDEVDLVWHTESDLSQYDAIVLPGGFSYGDYLRCGAIARFSPVMKAVKDAAAEGKLVLGICNGFQVLTECGLLPGGLLKNDHLQFRCEMTPLVVKNPNTAFTNLYAVGETIRIPIAHGEGRYYADPKQIEALRENGQIAFEYVTNPNGSVESIAGITNASGNVLGMMPHPERAVIDWMGSTDGERMFQAMSAYCKSRDVTHVGDTGDTCNSTDTTGKSDLSKESAYVG